MSRIRPALWTRCGGRCEISGRPLEFDTFDAHHRRNKGMGGDPRPDRDDLDNLLALDPGVHNGGPGSVHGRRTWAEARGYLVPKHAEHPGSYPVLLRGRRWVLLDKSGRYHPLPPVCATPAL